MDRRSWLWRRRSSEKIPALENSPAKTESSGSVSSHSERFSDEQEALKAYPNYAESPEVSLKETAVEVDETLKVLAEKLSDALLEISAKEDLVKQHAKVAEEAVLGWEKVEKELTNMRHQLNAATQKNSTLEDRCGHLDGALKECVRQLRRVREEQEQKIHEVLVQQMQKWEAEKMELQLQATELRAKLEAKAEASSSTDHELHSKLESLEKENLVFKVELLARSKELQSWKMEKELSTRAAEAASKQHLESIKKAAKLEAECRRLRAASHRSPLAIDSKLGTNSICVDSITDSQSDSGERLLGADNASTCSDSWASALLAELDQFKSGKNSSRNLSAPLDIELMDDFLEMERLALTHETGQDNPSCRPEDARSKMAELEVKIEKLSVANSNLEKALEEAQSRLLLSCQQLAKTEERSAELQRQLNLVNGQKHAVEMEAEALETKRNELELQLESAQSVVGNLGDKVRSLEAKAKEESVLLMELRAKCQHMDALEATRQETALQLESARSEAGMLNEKVSLLERKLELQKLLSMQLAAKCQNAEAEKREADLRLKSANEEIRMLQEKAHSLEGKLEEERTVSAEFLSKCHDMDVLEKQKKELEFQLVSANELHEKVCLLERILEEERALCVELSAKCDSLEIKEEKRKKQEGLLQVARLEEDKLREKISSLEEKVEEERKLCTEHAAHLTSSELERKKSADELKSAHKDIEEIRVKLVLLEKQVLDEKAMSVKFMGKCQHLEDQLSRNKQQCDLRQPEIRGNLKIKQERELARAAGKLSDCQKTIASLNQQLKSLANLDDFLLEAEENGAPEAERDGDMKVVYQLHALKVEAGINNCI